ncbi:spore coat protein [Alkalibacillus haloalkaliphilus]|uniref:Spore coat protein F-like protein YraF n=1 Tax=Alkalibacillus haloalkaliphilus TaxID=94136 RepID=A0A511W310_9BACI|nr:spore coat protein [Alkalibacillus haloalkaliphilus]GEN45464.1 spore coat protein F-like protein YraF [Alkalibacillus haloalkaliphilus]
MNDYLDPLNAVGMPEQVDSAIALDLLITTKEAVRNYSIALTEATSPEVRTTIRNQMEAAIDFQEEVTNLMMEKQWFHPYDLSKQQLIDLQAAQTAVDIAGLNLFPDNHNRKGLFPTPPK